MPSPTLYQQIGNREMTAKRFPTFSSHSMVGCFNCGGDLDGSYFADSGNAAGHGQFRQDCEKCSTATWYDLAPTFSDDDLTAIADALREVGRPSSVSHEIADRIEAFRSTETVGRLGRGRAQQSA
jgi:predicted  nucleic acid-binding Zn-ribbon protein